MKKTTLIKVLYGYIISQIAILCVTASLMGVVIADERTKFMQTGETVAVQIEKPMTDINSRVFRILMKDRIKSTLSAFPAPVGNIVSLYICLEEIIG